MSNETNPHIQIAQIQNKILTRIGLSSEEALFEFKSGDGETVLNLVTINPAHNQSFLFNRTQGKTRIEALQAMLEYVQSYREEENSYTIQWAGRGESRLVTSYFRGSDIWNVLEKFTYGRDRSTIVIYSVSLNPVT